ncbi:hypothetical protein [Variovorax sp. YR752]|uniref:hypothetical protein n=1 Tax=Variovorax sp. YR752 TaxID=1884383 RepID=UPI003137710D
MTTVTMNIPAHHAFTIEGPAPRLSDWLARAVLKLQSVGDLLRMPAPGVPEATAQLLRMAEAYESTQPSYAADLRAAATMAGQAHADQR